VHRASTVARYKSAKYTVERPLLVGGAIAGADEDLREAYSGYGLPLGEAFQLRDDILGVFGDPDLTGKPAGDDLREGKRTFLVAAAFETADPADAAVLGRDLGRPDLDDDGVAELRRVITASGALDRTERRIETLATAALEALTGARLDPEPAQVLTELADAATRRAR
jgi:geranylgeranyl diphosphate synthase type I